VFRDWAAGAPDEASMLAAIITGPPEPFVPPELVGQKAVASLGCWCGYVSHLAVLVSPGLLAWLCGRRLPRDS
jgi:hypothetical protein